MPRILYVCFMVLFTSHCTKFAVEPYDGAVYDSVRAKQVQVIKYQHKNPINTNALAQLGYEHMGGFMIKTNGRIISAEKRGRKIAQEKGAHLLIVNHRNAIQDSSGKKQFSAKGAFAGKLELDKNIKNLKEVYFVLYHCNQDQCDKVK